MVAYYHPPPLKLNYATNVIVVFHISDKSLLLKFLLSDIGKKYKYLPVLCTFY